MDLDPVPIDLSHINLEDSPPPREAFPKNPIEVEAAAELGFPLTGMQPSKFQRAVSAPPGKALHGVLWGYGLATFGDWHLSRMAAEDRLHIGGTTALVSDEVIHDHDNDLIRRPETRTQIALLGFLRPPILEVTFTLSSYFWSPEDSWVQFFIGREMIGKLFIGGRKDEQSHRFGFRFTNVPNPHFMIHTRLATEKVNRGFMLFDEVRLRVEER